MEAFFHLSVLQGNWGIFTIIRVLPSGTLSETLDFENFATASRSCSQENSSMVNVLWQSFSNSTVELIHTYYSWVVCDWMHVVCYVSVDRNAVTLSLIFVDLLYNLLPHWHSAATRGSSALAELLVCVVGISAVSSIQCFDTVIWTADRKVCSMFRRISGGHAPLNLAPNKFQEMPFGASRMQRSPRPPSGLLPPQEPHLRSQPCPWNRKWETWPLPTWRAGSTYGM